SVNSKPDHLSSSKTVARKFINEFLKKNSDFILEEVDLYKDHIPRLEYQYFKGRSELVSEEEAKELPEKDQKEIKRIRELCDQFISAQVYVIAAPMWSLSFPAPLKEYIDCVVQKDKTITIEPGKKPKGLLDDEYRSLVYVQSSGGNIPWIMDPIMDRGENYISTVMKTMGIKNVVELKVDGTGTTEEERRNAIEEAEGKIDGILSDFYIY
ncbi:MAG: FMN-dependent NADH-azoreductase, partial [Clostridium sp.]